MIILYVDINKLHVSIIILHIDIDNWNVNIFFLHEWTQVCPHTNKFLIFILNLVYLMILINFQISSLMLLSIWDTSVWVVWEYFSSHNHSVYLLYTVHLLYILYTHGYTSKQQTIEELDFTRICTGK